jgi:hypothetical protein
MIKMLPRTGTDPSLLGELIVKESEGGVKRISPPLSEDRGDGDTFQTAGLIQSRKKEDVPWLMRAAPNAKCLRRTGKPSGAMATPIRRTVKSTAAEAVPRAVPAPVSESLGNLHAGLLK